MQFKKYGLFGNSHVITAEYYFYIARDKAFRAGKNHPFRTHCCIANADILAGMGE